MTFIALAVSSGGGDGPRSLALSVCTAAAAPTLAFIVALACAQTAQAWVIPASAPRDPACPAIPDAGDVHLSEQDLERVRAGEIIVRVGEMDERGRRVWAVGYLRSNPVWLFDVGTDSHLAPQLSEIIERVDVLDERPNGKTVHGIADPAMLLPKFDYTLAVSYLADETGQCWAQIKGDFKRNEGSHSYLWDPKRRETLAVFTFELSLKGMLSLLPEDVVRRLTARTLPTFMHNLEQFAIRLQRGDPERAARNEGRWNALRARLEANELPGRVWHGPPSAAVEIRAPIRMEAAAAD